MRCVSHDIINNKLHLKYRGNHKNARILQIASCCFFVLLHTFRWLLSIVLFRWNMNLSANRTCFDSAYCAINSNQGIFLLGCVMLCKNMRKKERIQPNKSNKIDNLIERWKNLCDSFYKIVFANQQNDD